LTAKQWEMVSSKTALFDFSSSAEIAVEAARVLDKAEIARFKTKTIRGDLNNHIKCGIQIAKKAIEVLAQRALSGRDKELSKDRFLSLMQEKEELKREIEMLKNKQIMKSPKYTRAVVVGTSPVSFAEREATERTPFTFGRDHNSGMKEGRRIGRPTRDATKKLSYAETSSGEEQESNRRTQRLEYQLQSTAEDVDEATFVSLGRMRRAEASTLKRPNWMGRDRDRKRAPPPSIIPSSFVQERRKGTNRGGVTQREVLRERGRGGEVRLGQMTGTKDRYGRDYPPLPSQQRMRLGASGPGVPPKVHREPDKFQHHRDPTASTASGRSRTSEKSRRKDSRRYKEERTLDRPGGRPPPPP